MARLIVLLLFFTCLSLGGRVMPWMCLERCGENIQADLAQIANNRTSFTAVSFEDYDLGPNSELIYNNFTSVNGIIQSFSLQGYPMITTVNIDFLRELFNDPHPFLAEAIANAIEFKYVGYCLDYEPEGGSNEDAENYAQFLTTFANQLHERNKVLQVCVASWDPFWNFTLIAESTVDTIITMDTYADDDDTWMDAFLYAYDTIPLEKLGIGFITETNDGQIPSKEYFQYRFNALEQYGIQEIDIWDSPIPGDMWPFINHFRKSTTIGGHY